LCHLPALATRRYGLHSSPASDAVPPYQFDRAIVDDVFDDLFWELRQLHIGTPVVERPNERLRTAMERGVEAAPEDYDLYISLSQRIRLPNTERSKSQAG
jgi:hypothetical protein